MAAIRAVSPERLAAVARALALGGLAGMIAGILVGGFSSRLVMRVSAALSRPEQQGTLTENGNRVGEITLGGTFGLVVFGGLLPGIIGGTLYVLYRPWLRRFGRWHGLVFGLALLALFGSAILDPRNFDFRVFGPAWLNVGLFVALFPIYGLALGWITEHVEPHLARAGQDPGAAPWTVAGAVGALAAVFVLVLGVGGTIASLTGANSEGRALVGLVFFGLLFGSLALRAWAPGARWAYVPIAAVLAFGAYRTLGAIATILG